MPVVISNSSNKWLNKQISLTGGTVNIDVENKTTLTCAMIAFTTGDTSHILWSRDRDDLVKV